MTWLTNLRIWDGYSASLREDVDTIQILEGKIKDLTTRDQVNAAGCQDMGGLYVMPGLIDAHVHMCLNPEIMNPEDQDKFTDAELLGQIEERARRMQRAGITTARDLGGGRWLELQVRDRIRRGEISGTRLICAGQPVTSVMGHCHFWGGEASSVVEALAVIDRQRQHGVDLVKVMATGGQMTRASKPSAAQFDVASLTAIVAEATRHGYHVAAHCHGTAGIRNAALAGVTTIEHCSWVGDEGWARSYDDEVSREIARRGIHVSPTINVGWKRRMGNVDYETVIGENYRRMRLAGVRLIASTDAGIPQVFHHDLPKALPVFAHFAGLSNVEVLRAATADGAAAIGLGNLTGRIEAGLSADLIFLEQNPLQDLAALTTLAGVMCAGSMVAS
jgi:imidazolonepropionase-like amidohydrolase